jgi:putative oxidoreductase
LERIHPGWGVTAVRVVAGIILVIAGWGKLTGGIEEFAGGMTQMGLPAAQVLAPLVVAFELVGGLLILVGAGVRWLGFVMVAQFLILALYVQMPSRGFGGARLDLMMAAAGLMLVLAGAGKASVDEWLARRKRVPALERL